MNSSMKLSSSHKCMKMTKLWTSWAKKCLSSMTSTRLWEIKSITMSPQMIRWGVLASYWELRWKEGGQREWRDSCRTFWIVGEWEISFFKWNSTSSLRWMKLWSKLTLKRTKRSSWMTYSKLPFSKLMTIKKASAIQMRQRTWLSKILFWVMTKILNRRSKDWEKKQSLSRAISC
jgi:hypothetical protein